MSRVPYYLLPGFVSQSINMHLFSTANEAYYIITLKQFKQLTLNMKGGVERHAREIETESLMRRERNHMTKNGSSTLAFILK